jgi:hypothetical protein
VQVAQIYFLFVYLSAKLIENQLQSINDVPKSVRRTLGFTATILDDSERRFKVGVYLRGRETQHSGANLLCCIRSQFADIPLVVCCTKA